MNFLNLETNLTEAPGDITWDNSSSAMLIVIFRDEFKRKLFVRIISGRLCQVAHLKIY